MSNTLNLRKRIFLLMKVCLTSGLFVFFGCANGDGQTLEDIESLKADITYVCDIIPKKYVYFPSKLSNWDEACSIAQKEANFAQKKDGLRILERLIFELYDSHVNLGVASGSSPYLVPTNSDIAVNVDGGKVRITHLKPQSPASHVLEIDDIVLEIDGLAIQEAAKQRMRTGSLTDSTRMRWAIMAELTGYRDRNRRILIERNEERQAFEIEPSRPLIRPVFSAVGKFDNSVCFIRLHNSLGANGLLKEIYSFLNEANCENGIILDLRDTPSGGNTGVAEPLLGLFIDAQQPYQITQYADGRKIPAYPQQLESSYTEIPMAILVGPWTGSMGEGIAIGFDGTGRAPVLGGQMAGLGGSMEVLTLPGSGYPLQLPTIDLLHVNGTTRSDFRSPEINELNLKTFVKSNELRESLTSYLQRPIL